MRPEHFVTQKIISAARRIAEGSKEILEIGRLDISRDWGWAPEYVKAMWLILQQNKAENFVIATGETNTLEKFVEVSFAYFNLDWKNYVRHNKNFMRPTDIMINVGDSNKAYKKLRWKAKFKMADVVKLMLNKKC